MKLSLVGIYPDYMNQKYLLSCYMLKGYVDKMFSESNDLTVSILNFPCTADASDIRDALLEEKPDFIGYSCYIWNMDKVLEVCELLKDIINPYVIYGGHEISESTARKFLAANAAHYCIVGEGERKLSNLLKYLMHGSHDKDMTIPTGVAYLDGGEFQYIEDRTLIKNLDEVPSPYLNHIIDDVAFENAMVFMETQRGCRSKCKYCVYNRNFKEITYYSLDRVFQELDYLIVEKKVYSIWLIDAIFTSNLERAKTILRYIIELKDQGHEIPWLYTEFTYYSADEEFISLLSKLKVGEKICNTESMMPIDRAQHYVEMAFGYRTVNNIGLQSFAKKTLKAIGRPPITEEKFAGFMQMAREYNIMLKIDLILGLPYESFDSYFEGIDYLLTFLKDTDHIMNIHILQILPGSSLEERCEEYGINYIENMSGAHFVHSTSTLTEEELKYAALLSGILFRIVNSPIRPKLYKAMERAGDTTVLPILQDIAETIKKTPKLKNTEIASQDMVDDVYWNDIVFKEIPSKFLSRYLRSYGASS